MVKVNCHHLFRKRHGAREDRMDHKYVYDKKIYNYNLKPVGQHNPLCSVSMAIQFKNTSKTLEGRPFVR